MKIIKSLFKKQTVKADFVERRNNNPQLDAHAIAKGLKRRREDKINDMFYSVLVTILVVVLGFFTMGSFVFFE